MPRGKRDTNEKSIIDALRQAGCDVYQLEDRDKAGLPDLLVLRRRYAYEGWRTEEEIARFLEVKTETGSERPEQQAFRQRWPSLVHVVRTPIEALSVMGIQAKPIPRETRHVAQAVQP